MRKFAKRASLTLTLGTEGRSSDADWEATYSVIGKENKILQEMQLLGRVRPENRKRTLAKIQQKAQRQGKAFHGWKQGS